MKYFFILFLVTAAWQQLPAQELYVFTEPASNMPAHSLSARLTGRYTRSLQGNGIRQRYIPELMFGFSKRLMVHVSGTLSDVYTPKLRMESAKLYGKWRFYSEDDIHRHFRMAAFAEGAYSRNPYTFEELNLDGDHSGLQGGLIVTQLLNKLAISATAGIIKALTGTPRMHNNVSLSTGAINYSISAGYLLLPHQYTGYKQPNVNLYMEVIGMKQLGDNTGVLDLAPALQLILNSNTKINAGYRFQVAGKMLRIGNQSLQIGVERTFLGALPYKRRQ